MKIMKTPIEQAKNNLIVYCSLPHKYKYKYSESIIKEIANQDLKGKQISRQWSLALKWNGKKKKRRIISEKNFICKGTKRNFSSIR